MTFTSKFPQAIRLYCRALEKQLGLFANFKKILHSEAPREAGCEDAEESGIQYKTVLFCLWSLHNSNMRYIIVFMRSLKQYQSVQ